ncbi:MAG TPA: hypothetical protein PL009_11255 [Flavipsychrobacter sp.]|nr:hypothetical protein [Flavipsychrobacter sp.]
MTYQQALTGTYEWQNIHKGQSYHPYKLPLKTCIPAPDDLAAYTAYLLRYLQENDWRSFIHEFYENTFHVVCVFQQKDETLCFLSYQKFLRCNGIFIDFHVNH